MTITVGKIDCLETTWPAVAEVREFLSPGAWGAGGTKGPQAGTQPLQDGPGRAGPGLMSHGTGAGPGWEATRSVRLSQGATVEPA